MIDTTTWEISYIDGESFIRPLSRNEIHYRDLCWAKRKRESRLSYRLKKWFTGLRPVNNWLWRRDNCVNSGRIGGHNYWHEIDFARVGDPETVSARGWASMFGERKCMVTLKKPYTMALPDYTSIRRTG